MNTEDDNVIGIVGGMGPEAGLSLFNHILSHTEGRVDQEHLSVVLTSFPKHIVDRTLFLQGDVYENPAYSIANIIRKLELTGAKIIGIACNTSHAPEIYNIVLEELEKRKSQVQLINMPFETCLYIRNNYANVKRIGVMSTNGTYRSGIYERLLKDWGYEVILPDFKFQNDIIHKMIYDPEFGIKSKPGCITPEANLLMNNSLEFFKENGSDAIILGCTELSSMIVKKEVEDMVVINSIEVLALALIREAKTGTIREIKSFPPSLVEGAEG